MDIKIFLKTKVGKVVAGAIYTLGFIGIPLVLNGLLLDGGEPILIKWLIGAIVFCILGVISVLFYGGITAILDKIK